MALPLRAFAPSREIISPACRAGAVGWVHAEARRRGEGGRATRAGVSTSLDTNGR
jgi:hypothetical protein